MVGMQTRGTQENNMKGIEKGNKIIYRSTNKKLPQEIELYFCKQEKS